jgi:hypothetical protein
MCAAPISNGWSPKVFEILILTFVPPAEVCTMSRRVWFRKLSGCLGEGGCGAVAHVPIHCLPLVSCPVARMESNPTRAQVTLFEISLFMVFTEMSC